MHWKLPKVKKGKGKAKPAAPGGQSDVQIQSLSKAGESVKPQINPISGVTGPNVLPSINHFTLGATQRPTATSAVATSLFSLKSSEGADPQPEQPDEAPSGLPLPRSNSSGALSSGTLGTTPPTKRNFGETTSNPVPTRFLELLTEQKVSTSDAADEEKITPTRIRRTDITRSSPGGEALYRDSKAQQKSEEPATTKDERMNIHHLLV
jgi:hypothetical protein